MNRQKNTREPCLTIKAGEKWILWIFALVWLTLLLWLSAENGTATRQTSSRLTAAIMDLLQISADNAAGLNHLLRTLAHVFVFFMFGGAVYCVAWVTQPYLKEAVLPSVILCAILAVIDEVKKLWIPGRHLDWGEMGLNCIGAAAGICMALYCIWRSTRRLKAMYGLHAVKPELM